MLAHPCRDKMTPCIEARKADGRLVSLSCAGMSRQRISDADAAAVIPPRSNRYEDLGLGRGHVDRTSSGRTHPRLPFVRVTSVFGGRSDRGQLPRERSLVPGQGWVVCCGSDLGYRPSLRVLHALRSTQSTRTARSIFSTTMVTLKEIAGNIIVHTRAYKHIQTRQRVTAPPHITSQSVGSDQH